MKWGLRDATGRGVLTSLTRMAGWSAHRMEELYGAGRIIRPAYNSVMPNSGEYVPLAERG